jgi:hypothetical protein
MINRQFLTFLGIGLVVVVIGLGLTFYGTQGAHLNLEGKILKVRTLPTDEKTALIVVDFRVTNLATKQTFVVKDAVVVLKTADGKEVEADTVARTDVNRIFDYYKVLGPKYNETLIIRDKVGGGQTMDRMLAATIALPESDVEKRRGMTLRLHDVDGPTFELKEAKP